MVSVSHFLVLLGIYVVGVGILLLLLWPRASSGARLLRNWGVPEATSEQSQVARRYLRDRRLLYALFILLSAPLSGLTVLVFGRLFLPYIGWFLGALLLGELIAMLRPVRGQVRVAALERRGVRDLLPRWMMAVHLVTVAAAVVAQVVLYSGGDNDPAYGPLWFQLLVTVGSAAAVYVVVWLAAARPAIGDPQVDRALRLRTARVIGGIGTMLAATLLAGALNLIGIPHGNDILATVAFVVQLLGLAMWAVMVSAFAFWTGYRGQVPARNG